MKMTKNVFNQLSQDFHTVLTGHFGCALSETPEDALIDAYAVFKEVWQQRSYDDTHPRWQYNYRVLSPDWSENQGYLDWVYDNEGDPIHDDHIKTALKKIVSQYHKT